VDDESRLRGVTIYCPDRRVPLHPTVLSEDAASLRPGAVRPAFVWDLVVGGDGELRDRSVRRATVRSTAEISYEHAERQIAAGTDDERLMLLREVGTLLIEAERARGGASLPSPQQEVRLHAGHVELRHRPASLTEDWNAQLSLLTGRCAAELMLDAGVGILRTMAPPDDRAVDRIRREAVALGVEWPIDQPYGDLLRSLDRANPHHMAFVHAATSLFRGAGYTVVDGEGDRRTLVHSAVAAPYAHVTAPLRRLVDRFGLVICEALVAGSTPPDWAIESLPALPEIMARSDRTAGAVSRACIDAVEAAFLSERIGARLPAIVIDMNGDDSALVRLSDLPIETRAVGAAEPGSAVQVIVESADVAASSARLRIAPTFGSGGPTR